MVDIHHSGTLSTPRVSSSPSHRKLWSLRPRSCQDSFRTNKIIQFPHESPLNARFTRHQWKSPQSTLSEGIKSTTTPSFAKVRQGRQFCFDGSNSSHPARRTFLFVSWLPSHCVIVTLVHVPPSLSTFDMRTLEPCQDTRKRYL